RYKSLLSATDTVLLIICAYTDELSLTQHYRGDRVIQNITELTATALQNRIPVFLARYEHIPDDALLSGHAEAAPDGVRTFVVSTLNPFAHDDLRTSLEDMNLSRLVL